MRFTLTTLIVFLISVTVALAQPANDNCATALTIDQVERFCSGAGAYTNVGATTSTFGKPDCFSAASRDVWFVFVPKKTTVTITVVGAERSAPGGTLRQPEVALYTGSCSGTLNQLRCGTDAAGNNIVEITRGGLAVGVPHLIRVQGRSGATGTFQLCINNFNPPAEPGQDCPKAAILCNKEPFSVRLVAGPGNDSKEANDASCFFNVLQPGESVESSSIWYTWTAATNGTLTFALTPINLSDDLDFVIYELPRGPLDCRDKKAVRCMASGGDYPGRCMGPTGLRDNSTDVGEQGGCADSRQDNWLAPLVMEAGKTYALFVNNFSDSGNGFNVQFGGTGEFQGPKAAFKIDEIDRKVCVGEDLVLTDSSTFALGSIVKWEWSFGPGASIASATGKGPHQVRYTAAGLKSVVLTVTSDRGCSVTEIGTVLVECCPNHFSLNGQVSDIKCTGQSNGSIDLSVTNAFGPYQYKWSSGQSTQDLSGLGLGTFMVTISDAATCDTVASFTVGTAPPFEIDTLVTKPTCNGGRDGAVVLQVKGGTPSYSYNWRRSGFAADNALRNIGSGDYEVIVRDQNNCSDTLLIPVRELELLLDSRVGAIDTPSCDGLGDGAITVNVANGRAPFQYDWNDGRGFLGINSLQNLRAGTYKVTVRDANLCRGQFTFEMQAPPPLTLDFSAFDASCNGVSDGEAAALAGGGVGNFSYSWSDGQRDSVATGLRAGSFNVTVTDGNNCMIQGQVTIGEPLPVTVNVLDVGTGICAGEANGRIALKGNGGTAPYEFSLDGKSFQKDSIFTGLRAGQFLVTIMDMMGCRNTVNASITEPDPLVVDAGSDQTIKLGYDARIRALANMPGVRFEWSPAGTLSCKDCPNPLATPVSSTVYTVTIIDEKNCKALDSLRVNVIKDRPVYTPNVFSPNDDGSNDYFSVFGGPAVSQIRRLRIFDRWGELIYEGESLPVNDEAAGWDGTFRGKPLGSGVFVFVAEVEFIDQEVITYQGDVTLVR